MNGFLIVICFPLDPKVEVIYVSPVELNDEVYQYYSKLLGMKAQRMHRYETGNEDDDGDDEEGEDIENRYKIIVPDAVERFPVSLIPNNKTNIPAGDANWDLRPICFTSVVFMYSFMSLSP